MYSTLLVPGIRHRHVFGTMQLESLVVVVHFLNGSDSRSNVTGKVHLRQARHGEFAFPLVLARQAHRDLLQDFDIGCLAFEGTVADVLNGMHANRHIVILQERRERLR